MSKTRYISKNPNLTILNNNGTVRARFKQGEYSIDPLIDATGHGATNIQLLFPEAYNGDHVTDDQADNLSRAGMGTIASLVAGTDNYGVQRTFYEAPDLEHDSSAIYTGFGYVVTEGYATYQGVDYYPGDIFIGVADTDDLDDDAGASKYHLVWLLDECEYDKACEFKKKLLLHTDDALNYGTPYNGFTPRISNSYTDTDFIGTII